MTINQNQKKNRFQITVGADPEFFLRTGNVFVPSTNVIGGTKKSPIPIPGLPEGYTMQEDNIMGEFNIPASKTAGEFSNNILIALQGIQNILPKNTEMVIQPSAVFKSKFVKSRAAKVFGCDPDFNAWTERTNIFIPSNNENLRCCGGHVHIGLPDELKTQEHKHNIIRAMDVFLGLPSIIMDKDTQRREMYGKAGAFRPKKYGVEYRTLSNFWIATTELRRWVFNETERAVETSVDEGLMKEINSLSGDVIEAINTQHPLMAEQLCKHFKASVL